MEWPIVVLGIVTLALLALSAMLPPRGTMRPPNTRPVADIPPVIVGDEVAP